MAEKPRDYANHLTPRAMKIMDMVIAGLKSGAIADKLGLTVQYISTIVHAPQFEHQLAIRRERFEEEFDHSLIETEQEAASILKRNAAEAARKLVKLLDSESEAIVHKTSTDIMDRVGPTKQNRNIDIAQTNIIINDSMASLIKETLEMDRPKKKIDSKEIEN